MTEIENLIEKLQVFLILEKESTPYSRFFWVALENDKIKKLIKELKEAIRND